MDPIESVNKVIAAILEADNIEGGNVAPTGGRRHRRSPMHGSMRRIRMRGGYLSELRGGRNPEIPQELLDESAILGGLKGGRVKGGVKGGVAIEPPVDVPLCAVDALAVSGGEVVTSPTNGAAVEAPNGGAVEAPTGGAVAAVAPIAGGAVAAVAAPIAGGAVAAVAAPIAGGAVAAVAAPIAGGAVAAVAAPIAGGAVAAVAAPIAAGAVSATAPLTGGRIAKGTKMGLRQLHPAMQEHHKRVMLRYAELKKAHPNTPGNELMKRAMKKSE